MWRARLVFDLIVGQEGRGRIPQMGDLLPSPGGVFRHGGACALMRAWGGRGGAGTGRPLRPAGIVVERGHADFRKPPQGEVRRMGLPRAWVHGIERNSLCCRMDRRMLTLDASRVRRA